jgi:hypothetical protein
MIITRAAPASYTATFEPVLAPVAPFVSTFPPMAPASGGANKVVEKRHKARHRCVVPKLRGFRLSKAKRKLRRAGCRYRVRGKGRVVSTSPKRGTRTAKTVLVRASRKRSR